jgi:hypothetical protein
MPSTEQHLAKARHNEAFLGTFDLANPRYLDWAVTAIFYAALDRAFERLQILKRNARIYGAYRQLKDDSRAARYDMWEPRPPEVVDLRDEELKTIREFVLANL